MLLISTLSLDGGGFQSLSQLYILLEIMQRLHWKLKLDAVPLPCEHFDLIGGSGSGGIVALLIGRFRLPVEEAIELFIRIYQGVFSGAFDKLGERSTKLLEVKPSCKMFVCAMPTSTPTGPQPVRLFRNFRPRKHVSFDCEIWEAARATTANPLLFTPVLIGPNWVPESFIDPGFRFNNPIELVIEEASSLYTPSTTEFSFLSLGAGNPGISNALVNEEVNWAAALHDIARDCEGTANQVARRSLPGYFRLNVSQGLQAIDLETSTAPGCIASHTQQYLRDVSIDQRLDEIVENLVKRHRQVTASSDNSYGTAIARSIDNGMTKFAMVLDKVVPAFPW